MPTRPLARTATPATRRTCQKPATTPGAEGGCSGHGPGNQGRLTRAVRRDRATALEAVNVEELGRRVDHWVEAGVISREQGHAILALEGAHPEPAGGRRAVAVEVLGYLGGGLALVAGVVLGGAPGDRLGHSG